MEQKAGAHISRRSFAVLEHSGVIKDVLARLVARQPVLREFAELFMPAVAAWQAKTHADARQAVKGILRAEGFG